MRITEYANNLHYDSHHVARDPPSTANSSQVSALSAPLQDPPQSTALAAAVNDAPVVQETRRCSVKGCGKLMPQDAANRMCNECRGRHRVYAMTKRAKRKQEKAAILSQTAGMASSAQPATIWMPEETIEGIERQDQADVATSLSDNYQAPSRPQELASSVPYDPALDTQWENNILDPRLFASQSSELAKALAYPTPSSQSQQIRHRSGTPIEAGSASGSYHTPQTPHPEAQPESGNASSVPEADQHSDAPVSSSSSARFCSVKGCKAIIRGEYFFKMCESCRNRYRGYGITKRAKWKQSRDAANAELDALREEEDQRRAKAGLPPLIDCPADFHTWEEKTIEQIDGPGPVFAEDGSIKGPLLPARMCTVSHCHRILSGHYKYRRCEQHRLQNRYHSRLKRVREKDLKAIGPGARGDADGNGEVNDKSGKPKLLEPLFTSAPIDIVRGSREDDYDNEETMQYIEEMAGIPPAARGIRRENHVCSVKACFNLLSPSVPWKMCDTCRAHDRKVRHERRLRDLGELPPLPPRILQKKPKKSSEKATSSTKDDEMNDQSADPTTSSLAPSTVEDDSLEVPHLDDATADSRIVFTEPLIPPTVADENNLPLNGDSPTPAHSLSETTLNAEAETSTSTNFGESSSSGSSVRRRSRKVTHPSPGQTSFSATSTSAPVQSTTLVPPSNNGSYMPTNAAYPTSYYMPLPYGTPPYNAAHIHPLSSCAPPPIAGPSAHPPQVPTQLQPQPIPFPSQPYTYPHYPYGPYPSYGYPYIPPSQYGHLCPPYHSTYATPSVYGGHYPIPVSIHNPVTTQVPIQTQVFPSFPGPAQRPPKHRNSYVLPEAQPSITSLPSNHQSWLPQNASLLPITSVPPASDPTGHQHSTAPTIIETEHAEANGNLDGRNIGGPAHTNTDASFSRAERQCHMCQRTMASAVSGTICERCRTRLRKRAAKVKQRCKLEPRKFAIRVEAS